MTARHFTRLVKFMLAGSVIFIGCLLVVQVSLRYAGVAYDPTIYSFYLVMALLGGAFGFERWWAYEQGEYNPVHEK